MADRFTVRAQRLLAMVGIMTFLSTFAASQIPSIILNCLFDSDETGKVMPVLVNDAFELQQLA
jgi:hypothetical protein